jgi:hypothetical protein
MRQFLACALVLASSLPFLSCNSGTDADAGGGSGFTALIDGKPWEAEPIGVTAMVNAAVPGNVIILGNDGAAERSRSITVTLYNVRGPGRYALGVGLECVGGIGQTGEATGVVGDNSNSWITPGTGNDGEVILAEIGGGRIKGTFFFTADTGRRNTTGVKRTVTEGKFDLPLAGALPVLHERKGSTLTARLGDESYNAASVYGFGKDFLGQDGIRISTTSSLHGVNIELQSVTDTGTFALSNTQPIRTISAGRNGGDAQHCCWQTLAGAAGEIKVTSIIRNAAKDSIYRVKGSFKGTLQPSPGKAATADLEVLEGTFDVGVEY